MNLSKWFLGLSFIASLTACHENPMHTHSKQETIAFLRTAATHAEKEMHLNARKGGRFYANCMEGNNEEINCQQFFNAMLQFAKTSQAYSELTYKELTDAKQYAALAEDYQIKLFNSLGE